MANYPTSASTDANLYVAVNSLATSLVGALTSVGGNNGPDIEVTSTAGFPAQGFITIDQEAISYTSLLSSPARFSGITRGADDTTATSHNNGTDVKHNVIAAHHNALKEEIKAIETDLTNVQASITPVTATNTATSILNRTAMIVNQIKLGFGLTNWYDVLVEAVRISGNQTIAGIKDFTGQLLGKGTSTNDNAATGYIGEYVSSTVGGTNAPTTNTFGDLTSITVSAGDWDIDINVFFNTNGATLSGTILVGVGTASGNSSAGLTDGDTDTYITTNSTQTLNSTALKLRKSVASSTTFYLKMRVQYSAGTPQFSGRISARRSR